jgi:hypothetical protein
MQQQEQRQQQQQQQGVAAAQAVVTLLMASSGRCLPCSAHTPTCWCPAGLTPPPQVSAGCTQGGPADSCCSSLLHWLLAQAHLACLPACLPAPLPSTARPAERSLLSPAPLLPPPRPLGPCRPQMRLTRKWTQCCCTCSATAPRRQTE